MTTVALQRPTEEQNPRVGMLATVRNRRGLITAVEPYAGMGAVHHLVTVEYLDSEGAAEETLLWEREIGPRLLPPNALPDIAGTAPMSNAEFDALVRATRWSALTPFIGPDGKRLDSPPITAPLHGAIQVEDFQLVPLLKALQMPRISLLLADDVGLGKTIEAGLIMSELINRRRIRRIMILSPASLSLQWQDEMKSKFCLSFDIVDRDETHRLRKRVGMDANPWRIYSRCIASYYYLKQPDVWEQFRAASEPQRHHATLPWDLLIVDEAHNLMPSPMGEDSDLADLLAKIAPYFEHKVFLSATPHNGHTRSFSGLLERLDPVRFTQTSEFKPAERLRIEEVVVRRLKTEINAVTSPPRFGDRLVLPLHLRLGPRERRLASAFQEFKRHLNRQVATGPARERTAGKFAVEILGKRLLSCPATFADSWLRCRAGMRELEAMQAADVRAVKRDVEDDTGDDRERESRLQNASHVVGSWLKPHAEALQHQIDEIDESLEVLGFPFPWRGEGLGERGGPSEAARDPVEDTRWDAFCLHIENQLRAGGDWLKDERLIVFTEYKTTLDYLDRRLRRRYGDSPAIRTLFGGVSGDDREDIKAAFNNPSDPVRILLATDTGSEGQNLQETARYLLHYDIPWNPSRIEQRNGRIDRHGQARDVYICHFASNDDADIKFLAYVLKKVNGIREDLGSVGEVFDSAIEQKLLGGAGADEMIAELDKGIDRARGRAAIPRGVPETGAEESRRLDAFKAEIDLDPDTLRETLEVALSAKTPGSRIKPPDQRGRMELRHPIPYEWTEIIDDALRLPVKGGQQGPLPGIVFDPLFFLHYVGGRPIFRPDRDTTLLHLGHPVFRRALATFARYRFPAGDEAGASRWSVRRGDLPAGADALVCVTVEELAVNRLRETFHHWVRTLRFPVSSGELGEPLAHISARNLAAGITPPTDGDFDRARALWDDVQPDIRRFIDSRAAQLTETLLATLVEEESRARQQEVERFRSRQGEVSALIEENTQAKLEREIEALRSERAQLLLPGFEADTAALVASQAAKEEELERRRRHLHRMRDLLDGERKRVLNEILPNRFALHGSAMVFPVAVEIRLP
jgi:hypothetical protein